MFQPARKPVLVKLFLEIQKQVQSNEHSTRKSSLNKTNYCSKRNINNVLCIEHRRL